MLVSYLPVGAQPWRGCRVRARHRGFSLVEVLVVIAVIAVLASLLWPVFFQVRRSADSANCISNLRQCLQAVKMYEGDYGAVPVDAPPENTWREQLFPYVKERRVFLCSQDRTKGEVYRMGGQIPSSFAYYLNSYTLAKFGGLPPSPRSPLLICRSHELYQGIIGRYDGSIELPPPHRYRRIGYEGNGYVEEEQDDE